jgi:hypothetical protein
MNSQPDTPPTLLYEIRFRGTMDERYSRWFEGMSFSVLPEGETLIKGRITDQAALFGILNRLRDLNLELLEVRSYTEELKAK